MARRRERSSLSRAREHDDADRWTGLTVRVRIGDVIDRLILKNFGCIKDASIELTPIHAFIGPNDSGKSTILRAIEGLATFAAVGSQTPTALRLTQGPGVSAVLGDTAAGYVGFARREAAFIEVAGLGQSVDGREMSLLNANRLPPNRGPMRQQWQPAFAEAAVSLLVRFEPDKLRQASHLLTDPEPIRFLDETGLGLPAIYDALINRNVETFLTINRKVQELFPNVKGVRLKNPGGGLKAVAMELHDGQEVGAEGMSEGLLYYLAFAVLPYVQPTAVILVEEPENGLHPARIAEVMTTLRDVSKTRQVLIATHSPLVVNELDASEVSVVTRTREEGTKVTRLSETPDYATRAKVYETGELWLNYANGSDEGPLLKGGPRP